MKNSLLRILNSGKLLFALIAISAISGTIAGLIVFPEIIVVIAVLVGSLSMASAIIAHKVRRTAISVRETKTVIARINGLASSNLSETPKVGATEQSEQLRKLATTLDSHSRRCEEISNASTLRIAQQINLVAASCSSHVHPGISALTAHVLRERASSRESIAVTVAGGSSAEKLAKWLVGRRAEKSDIQTVGRNHTVLELALVEVLLIDFTDYSEVQTPHLTIMGHLLPGAEIWTIGNSLEGEAFTAKVRDHDPDLMVTLSGEEGHELQILRKVK